MATYDERLHRPRFWKAGIHLQGRIDIQRLYLLENGREGRGGRWSEDPCWMSTGLGLRRSLALTHPEQTTQFPSVEDF